MKGPTFFRELGGLGATMPRALPNAFRCLGWRLVITLTATLLVLLGASGWLAISLHRQHLYSLLEQTAMGMGETILSSTHSSMMRNDRRHLAAIVENIGRRESVLALRLVNAHGEVRYSNHPDEIGLRSNLENPVCQGCHFANEPHAPATLRDGLQVYSLPSGKGALGLGVPVLNTPECSSAACHVHPPDQRVLGILDLELSTDDLEHALKDARSQMAWLAILTVAIISGTIGLLAWRIVHRPVHTVLNGIRRLGGGELGTRIEELPPTEMGELAAAFNTMSERLENATEELEEWNLRLESKVRDKTAELERTRDQMIFAEKMSSLGQLAATVAHEINNPLAGVLVYTKLLRRRLGKVSGSGSEGGSRNGLEEMDETLATIESEVGRCGDIVRNLLLFARRGGTDREPADLNELVQRAQKLVQHKADLAEVEIQINGDATLPPVVCQGAEIQQAILAVIMNALEAMPEGGTLTLTTRHYPERQEAEITITDTGSGIPEELRDRIYEPFFSTKKDARGTGLGLTVLYGIMQRHKGRILMESKVGAGTTFRLLLPLEPEASPRRTLNEMKEGGSP